jgi:penicillin-binding protein 1A
LEKRYTKNEILEMYLNQIYFGAGAYGVQAAAESFFGKPISTLTLPESALLAAMPRSPSRYNPLTNKALAIKRRNLVLTQMRSRSLIDESAYRVSLTAPVPPPKRTPTMRAPGFVDYIRRRLEDESVLGHSLLYKGGLTIETTLSYTLQAAAETAVKNGVSAVSRRTGVAGNGEGKIQAALVAVDAETGGIRAMVGGIDETGKGFNRAVSAKRQPGSAFKPFVYALAVEQGMSPDRRILDAPVVFPDGRGGDWRPENFSRNYLGEISFRRALALSRNIPAVRLMAELGGEQVVRFARKLGIRSPLHPYPSLALGTAEVTLLELTAAFAVFPAGGIRAEPFGVRQVVDPEGRIRMRAAPERKRVMSAGGAAVMMDLLQSVISMGTARAAQAITGRVAGKTGTTSENRDALFVGCRDRIVAGVWMGRDNARPLGPGETGGRAALPVWIEFMRTVPAAGEKIGPAPK